MYGPDLAKFFYRKLLEDTINDGLRIDGSQAAWTLHNAMKHLQEEVSDSPYSFFA